MQMGNTVHYDTKFYKLKKMHITVSTQIHISVLTAISSR